jgi:hypothetical protein
MANYPRGLPNRWRRHWRDPWRWQARRAWRFKRWLRRNGYLSPNFTQAEASGATRNRYGTDVPVFMLKQAQRHAFRLERLRHRLGDQPISILSWYRNPRHNDDVGGATRSQHMRALATDHSSAWIAKVGRDRFIREAGRIFAKGGVGLYPSGSGHTDSRGWRARW